MLIARTRRQVVRRGVSGRRLHPKLLNERVRMNKRRFVAVFRMGLTKAEAVSGRARTRLAGMPVRRIYYK